jgi:uncharacterized protein (TIGR03790 family)
MGRERMISMVQLVFSTVFRLMGLVLVLAPMGYATAPERVLVVVNRGVGVSNEIAAYYAEKRGIPETNICRIRAPRQEQITRKDYDSWVEPGVRKCLEKGDARERIDFIVTTKGVPLKISGEGNAAVDSELTLLYGKIAGKEYPIEGKLPNPFYRQSSVKFTKERFGIYLVTRLDGFTLADVKAMIDRALTAKNRGNVVLDGTSNGHQMGERWLTNASRILADGRVVLDQEIAVVYGAQNVIGYAAWGSNDKQRIADGTRDLGFSWLPGAIATEYVSSDGRTFEEPPDDWHPASWSDRTTYWANSPQSLTADFIRQGATGASGHVDEPKLDAVPHPDLLFPAYLQGRTLAESFYLSIPYLSWMNVFIGDPLCTLAPSKYASPLPSLVK